MAPTHSINHPLIHRLPHEMLSEVFSHAVPDYIIIGNNTTPSPYTLDPFSISRVCKRWKAAIESTSAVWSRVTLHLDNVVEDSSVIDRILEDVKRCVTLTKKSETRKFSFTAQGASPNDAKVITKAFIHVLTSISSRLVSLRLDCFRTDVFDLEYKKWAMANKENLQLIQPSFPALEALQFGWGCDDPLIHLLFDFNSIKAPVIRLFRGAPLLRCLSLDSLRPLNGLNWTRITHLRIVNIYSSKAFLYYANILPAMRNLEALELSFIQRSSEHFVHYIDTDDGERLQIPVLENLKTLMITTFLSGKLEESCQYSHVYEIDLYHDILQHIPLAKNLKWIYARMHFIASEDVNFNQRAIEGPMDDYILQSGCVGHFHKTVEVGRSVETGENLVQVMCARNNECRDQHD